MRYQSGLLTMAGLLFGCLGVENRLNDPSQISYYDRNGGRKVDLEDKSNAPRSTRNVSLFKFLYHVNS